MRFIPNMIRINSIKYPNTYPNFTSKRPEIREAEAIVRKVNNEYPRVSSSIIDDFSNIDKFESLNKRYRHKVIDLRCDVDCEESPSYSDIRNLKILPKMISERKVGNCAEAAVLAGIAAKINGIEDVQGISFYSTDKGDLDHVALLVNNNKKPYIIDAWLGFADFVPKAIEKYKGEYGYLFNFSGKSDEKIKFIPEYWDKIERIDRIPQKELEKAFPQLLLSNKKRR